eukprot:NODE_100_length_20777_cov_0.240884.p16 type:complete len:130 gc:universal NODE_100_length_20777_cov_0.240884:8251-8640(+)
MVTLVLVDPCKRFSLALLQCHLLRQVRRTAECQNGANGQNATKRYKQEVEKLCKIQVKTARNVQILRSPESVVLLMDTICQSVNKLLIDVQYLPCYSNEDTPESTRNALLCQSMTALKKQEKWRDWKSF